MGARLYNAIVQSVPNHRGLANHPHHAGWSELRSPAHKPLNRQPLIYTWSMVNHSSSGVSAGIAGGYRHAKGIEQFDSYKRNFGLESGCWSTSRATNHAAQPREN